MITKNMSFEGTWTMHAPAWVLDETVRRAKKDGRFYASDDGIAFVIVHPLDDRLGDFYEVMEDGTVVNVGLRRIEFEP